MRICRTAFLFTKIMYTALEVTLAHNMMKLFLKAYIMYHCGRRRGSSINCALTLAERPERRGGGGVLVLLVQYIKLYSL